MTYSVRLATGNGTNELTDRYYDFEKWDDAELFARLFKGETIQVKL